MRCAQGIAKALGPGGILSRRARGFIYRDQSNLISVWNGQVVYGFSLLKDDVLMARLAPALEAAGYPLAPQDGTLRGGSTIAAVPGAEILDLPAEMSDYLATEPEPEDDGSIKWEP